MVFITIYRIHLHWLSGIRQENIHLVMFRSKSGGNQPIIAKVISLHQLLTKTKWGPVNLCLASAVRRYVSKGVFWTSSVIYGGALLQKFFFSRRLHYRDVAGSWIRFQFLLMSLSLVGVVEERIACTLNIMRMTKIQVSYFWSFECEWPSRLHGRPNFSCSRENLRSIANSVGFVLKVAYFYAVVVKSLRRWTLSWKLTSFLYIHVPLGNNQRMFFRFWDVSGNINLIKFHISWMFC